MYRHSHKCTFAYTLYRYMHIYVCIRTYVYNFYEYFIITYILKTVLQERENWKIWRLERSSNYHRRSTRILRKEI